MSDKHCAHISFERKKEFLISDSSIEILIDGSVLDTIDDGEQKVHEVLPGFHTFWIRIDYYLSPKIELQVLAGERYKFLCGSNWSGLKFFIYYFPYRHELRLFLKKL